MSNGSDTPKTAEELDKEERKKKALTAGGFLSLLPSIAGAIPGLRRSKQTRALEDMQAGRGAGAQAARAAASEAGRRTAGNLGGRGSSGLVRAGIASAERQTAIGAREAGRIGAQEGIAGTQGLIAEEQRRRNLGLQLGAGLGGGVAALIANQVAAGDQGPAGEEVGQALTGSDPMGLREASALGPTEAAGAGGALGPGGFSGEPTLPGAFVGGPRAHDLALETVAGQAVSPFGPTGVAEVSTDLQSSDLKGGMSKEGFALASIMSTEERFENAKLNYQESVVRFKGEKPFSSSRGGTDTKVTEEQKRRDMAAFEQELLQAEAVWNAGGWARGEGSDPANHDLLLDEFVRAQHAGVSEPRQEQNISESQ